MRPNFSADPNMTDILTRVRDALPALVWTDVEPPPGIARVTSGETPSEAASASGSRNERWRVLLCRFEMVDADGVVQKGVYGVDGTATCLTEPLVVRLPPALAEAASGFAGIAGVL